VRWRRQRAPGLFDPGLQLERTHLAWSRTALGFFADAALMTRVARRLDPPAAGYAIAVALALIGVGAWVHGRSTYAPRARALLAGRPPVSPRALRRLALATALVSTAAAAMALRTLLGG
jgi:uncharacterized membrane protein YidH (DUF202 family)